MSEAVTHRISAEGADLLMLAGVNDANLLVLEESTGVRVSMRGEQLTIAGELEAVEHVSRVVRAMIELARVGESLDTDVVHRPLANGGDASVQLSNGDYKIALPGMRRVVQPKSAGQQTYVAAMRNNDIVVGVGPAGTGKTYLAVATGHVTGGGELVSYIQRVRNRSRAFAKPTAGAKGTKPAKPATLVYRVLGRRGGMSLLEVVPATGRHHQIRVQLAGISHPIVGDVKYGAGEPLPDKSIALHAACVRVKHPTREEVVTIEAAPPSTEPWRRFRSTIDSYFESRGSERRRERPPD